jgi:tRNA pseudouridine55 synthase
LFTKKEFLSPVKLKTILADPQAKIYLLDKPRGVPSFQAVVILRRLLGLKKVGFAGTLDPLASGLLILATGRATKLLDYFHNLPKTYEAQIIFGQTSTTYDLEGPIEINQQAKPFAWEVIEELLKKFLGQQSQQAPLYSAKKVKGQALYKLARQGKKITPPSQVVEIYDLIIKGFSYPQLDLVIKCSAGTYIRSLAHDLGRASGQGALLGNLRRLAIGRFYVAHALPLEQANKELLENNSLSPEVIHVN